MAHKILDILFLLKLAILACSSQDTDNKIIVKRHIENDGFHR